MLTRQCKLQDVRVYLKKNESIEEVAAAHCRHRPSQCHSCWNRLPHQLAHAREVRIQCKRHDPRQHHQLHVLGCATQWVVVYGLLGKKFVKLLASPRTYFPIPSLSDHPSLVVFFSAWDSLRAGSCWVLLQPPVIFLRLHRRTKRTEHWGGHHGIFKAWPDHHELVHNKVFL